MLASGLEGKQANLGRESYKFSVIFEYMVLEVCLNLRKV
jgi:hypothetical protein